MHVTSWGDRPLSQKKTHFPKIIWSYWHDDNLPRSVRAAIKSWEIHAPDYEIRMLSEKTFEQFTGKLPRQLQKKSHQSISDWIRITLLAKHGGIWSDASIILLDEIENILPPADMRAGQTFMFFNRKWSTDSTSPMLETWFMTAPRNSEYFRKLAREYSLACISRITYIKLMDWIYKRPMLQGYPHIRYFTCFAAMQVVLVRNRTLPVIMADSESGPFILHGRCGYDHDKIASEIMNGDIADLKIIKLTGGDRKCLEAALGPNPLPETSRISRYFT